MPVRAIGVERARRPCRSARSARRIHAALAHAEDPPEPAASSARPPSTPCSVRPTAFAITCASRASCAGGMSPAGVFTRSRAQETASTTTSALDGRLRPAFASQLGVPDAPSPAQHGRVLLLGLVAIEPVAAEAEPLGRGAAPRRRPAASRRPAGTSSPRAEAPSAEPATRPRFRRADVTEKSALLPDTDQQDGIGGESVPVALRDEEDSSLLARQLGVLVGLLARPSSLTPGPNCGPLEDRQDQHAPPSPPRVHPWRTRTWSQGAASLRCGRRAEASAAGCTTAGAVYPGERNGRHRYPWAVKTLDIRDLVGFSDDEARHETLVESDHLWSEIVCLQGAQGLGPLRDDASDGDRGRARRRGRDAGREGTGPDEAMGDGTCPRVSSSRSATRRRSPPWCSWWSHRRPGPRSDRGRP